MIKQKTFEMGQKTAHRPSNVLLYVIHHETASNVYRIPYTLHSVFTDFFSPHSYVFIYLYYITYTFTTQHSLCNIPCIAVLHHHHEVSLCILWEEHGGH